MGIYEKLCEEGYYSQCGQDKLIVETLFPNKNNRTFVDIGANDGITFSNTYLLEKMGWTGITVEPIPLVYEQLAKNRTCITVSGCVSNTSGKKVFRLASMLSGILDEYDPKHLKRIESECGECEDILVDSYNINELLKKYNITHIDYLTIDVEGAETTILNSLDFDQIHVSVIGVENNYNNDNIPTLLTGKGFSFHSTVGDDFYINSIKRE